MKRLVEIVIGMVLCGIVIPVALARPALQTGAYTVALPLVVNPGQPADPGPTPQPPGGHTPAELAGTWFNGQLLNKDYYDPNTQTWQDAGGLGHMYEFYRDGTYLLVSKLELNTGPFCKSTVSKFERGVVVAGDGSLALTPVSSRTRTVIACGGNSSSDVEGDHATYSLPYQVGRDEKGHTILTLTEVQGVTIYYKDGLAAQMLGTWRRGAVQAEGFYNPATGEFAYPDGEGEWFRFKADGSYERGSVKFRYLSEDCNEATVSYETGTLIGTGSTIAIKRVSGTQTKANLCDLNEQIEEQLGAATAQRWIWALSDGDNALELIRIEQFEQYHYERES